MFQVPVQPRRHRDPRVPADHDPALAALDLEDIPAGDGRNDFEDKLIGMLGQKSLDQSACGPGSVRVQGARPTLGGLVQRPVVHAGRLQAVQMLVQTDQEHIVVAVLFG